MDKLRLEEKNEDERKKTGRKRTRNSFFAKMKELVGLYMHAMKPALPKMSAYLAEIPLYLETVANALRSFVDEESHCVKLLLALMIIKLELL